MKSSARQQIAITTAIVNVLILIITLGAFTLFTRYLLERNLNNDLIIEAEEIVTQHINIEDSHITYVNRTSDQTIEQDLLTDRLSAVILNSSSVSVGKFGVFSKPALPSSIDSIIKTNAKDACSKKEYRYLNDQMVESNEFTYLFYPILKDKQCYGTIVVAGDTKSINDLSQLTFTLSVIAVAFATLFNLLLGKAVANRILKPLNLLSTRMQQINLDTETPGIDSPYTKNDEISDLIDTFNVMAKRVSETAATQKSFIMDASHELKTPIARAVTDLDVIKQELEDLHVEPKLIKSLNLAQTDLKSVAAIINTLLQAAKLKQVSLKLTPISLSQLTSSLIEPLQKTYSSSKITVKSNLSNELALADTEVLSMILRNCLVNAYKYNINEGTVDIKATLIGNTYTLIIKNTVAKEGQSAEEPESYKLGFDIIRNLCDITKYEFSAKNSRGIYTATLSNIPQAPSSKRLPEVRQNA